MVDQLPVISGSASALLTASGTSLLSQSGRLSFSDADPADQLIVSIVSRKVTYADASGIDQSALLSSDQVAM